ncbi:MAG: diaminopimelate decarboxylase [Candidatus Azotimanducaceae bacterium]|jgi:diaminopimelate decarboxylase
MEPFHFLNNELHIEGISARKVAAEFGTPVYIYSRLAIETAYKSFANAFSNHDHLICYAVKANSNLGVLSLLARLGAGFDIVSGGELERVIRAGGDPAKVVFSGVGKQDQEIIAALTTGIACFNVESLQELERINYLASQLGLRAPISIRVNPDVDAKTHPYISTGLKENKFGCSMSNAIDMYKLAATMPSLKICGIDSHIGSQITELAPFLDAMTKILTLVDELESNNITLDHIDVGGGIGVQYADEETIHLEEYAGALTQLMGHRKPKLIFEPGRFLTANAGILLSKVINLKRNEDKNFAIIDAGMNDLIRPALYGSWQRITEVIQTHEGKTQYDVVGPICETGDFLGKNRDLAIAADDLVAIHSAGAYGFVMSSNYNSRNRPAEVIVSGSKVHCVRDRETIEDQLKLERKYPI